MNELLFFVLGLVIGGLSGITIMCMIQINRINHLTKSMTDKNINCRDDKKCEHVK